MSNDTIATLATCVVAMFGIQAWTIYCLVRLVITGHGVFERKRDYDKTQPRIFGVER